MDESILTGITGLSTQQQLYLTWAGWIISALGKLYGSAVNGGGLKRIFARVWLGNSVPRPIAQDYHDELKSEPIFQKSDTPSK